MAHINLSREADLILIAPASADFMAKLLHGRADDLLSLLCLARPRESVALMLAPAMNREMWHHPATQRNVDQLKADGAWVLGVGEGDQACGEVGDGRMLEPHQLLAEVVAHFQPKHLAGRRVLITAGPTFEPIDPVRGITNRSSGKMGFAIAQAAREAGAEVTVVAGPVALDTPHGVKRVNVTTAVEMDQAVAQLEATHDVFVATAAVADWRVAQVNTEKIKKSADARVPSLSFVENPDILARVAASDRARRGDLYCVGFAAESHDLLANSQAKRLRKGVPMLVGNLGPATFGQDDNRLLVIDDHGSTEWPQASKIDLARQLVAHIAQRLPVRHLPKDPHD
jgi:phosphopantothenoylcysteine decarboxylase/phosphopantothenate--cysteine ligase